MGPRLWCHLYLNKRHDDFRLVPILIGRGGKHTKAISDLTDTKVRIRGKGSHHAEVDCSEAPVPLQIAITTAADRPRDFVEAIKMMVNHMHMVDSVFSRYCDYWNLDPALQNIALWKFGEMSKDAEELLTQAELLCVQRKATHLCKVDKRSTAVPAGLVEQHRSPRYHFSRYSKGPACLSQTDQASASSEARPMTEGVEVSSLAWSEWLAATPSSYTTWASNTHTVEADHSVYADPGNYWHNSPYVMTSPETMYEEAASYVTEPMGGRLLFEQHPEETGPPMTDRDLPALIADEVKAWLEQDDVTM